MPTFEGQPLEILVPLLGLITAVSPHKVQQGALIDGKNTIIGADNALMARPGYQKLGTSAATRITGITSYLDPSGTAVLVRGHLTGWDRFQTDWTGITDLADPLAGSANRPVRFTTFQQSGLTWLYGVNDINTTKRWHSGLTAYSAVVAAPIGKDITVLNNRVVIVNTTEGGTRFPTRIRWSAFNDGTTWPGLAVADLPAGTAPILAITQASRVAAFIWRSDSIWTMQARAGGDADAFSFEKLTGGSIAGPISVAAIVGVSGVHYYLGTDLRIYLLAGVRPEPLSATIDPTLLSIINTSARERIVATHVPSLDQIWWFVPTIGDDPDAAIVLHVPSNRFETIQRFTESITAAAPIIQPAGLDWTTAFPGDQDWSSVAWLSWDAIPAGFANSVLLGFTTGKTSQFGGSMDDDGVALPYQVTFPLFSLGAQTKMRVQRIELFVRPSPMQSLLTVTLEGLLTPFDTVPAAIINILANLGDEATLNMPLAPGASSAANKAVNFLRLSLSGLVGGTFKLVGGNIFVAPDQRGDYGRQ